MRSYIATLLCIFSLVIGIYLSLNPNMWVLLHAWLKFETMANRNKKLNVMMYICSYSTIFHTSYHIGSCRCYFPSENSRSSLTCILLIGMHNYSFYQRTVQNFMINTVALSVIFPGIFQLLGV